MIFDGKAFAKSLEEKVAEQIKLIPVAPKVVTVLVGDDTASALYTRLKNQAAERVGIVFEILKLEKGKSTHELGHEIMNVGARADVDGVMVQLPIPEMNKEDQEKVLSMIPLDKDVDGLRWEQSGIMPATVAGIAKILDEIEQQYTNDLWIRKFAVLGGNGAVGRPLVNFLRSKGAQVDVIEWDTKDPGQVIKNSGAVISCVGKAGIVGPDMINPDTVVIDVGMSMKDGKMVGDMDKEVYQKASVAVPVPGGVGPVTIASLLQNVLEVRGKLRKM